MANDFWTHETFSLSPFDQHAPPVYTRWLLCFPLLIPSYEDTLCTTFRDELEVMLRRYPYLAGNVGPALGLQNPYRTDCLEIRHAGHPINLAKSNRFDIKIDRSLDYQSFHYQGMPSSELTLGRFTKLTSEPSVETWPQVLHVQINLITGGLILAVYIHHSVMDGGSMNKFIHEYAMCIKARLDPHRNETCFAQERFSCSPGCRSAALESALRVGLFQRRDLQNIKLQESYLAACPERKTISRSHWKNKLAHMPKPPPASGKSFLFATSKMKALKHSLSQHMQSLDTGTTRARNVTYLSTLDCISALLWTYNLRARRQYLQEDGVSRFLVAVDVRKKLKPPISKEYMGNTTLYNVAELPIKVLLEGDHPSERLLCKAATSIRHAINSVTTDFIYKRLSLLSTSPFGTLDINMRLANHGPDMYITSWASMCVEADFGGPLGRPQYVRKPWEPGEGANIVLPRCRQRNGTESEFWEVFVQAAEDDMERLVGLDGLGGKVERVV